VGTVGTVGSEHINNAETTGTEHINAETTGTEHINSVRNAFEFATKFL
jgi:hypothetical protein